MDGQSQNHDPAPDEQPILDEATQWVMCFKQDAADSEPVYATAEARDEAFWAWVTRSALHLRLFLEMLEAYEGLLSVDRADLA